MSFSKITIVGCALSLMILGSSCAMLQATNNTKVKKEAVLPRDREQIQQQAQQKAFNPESLSRGILSGDWAIETVNGKNAVGESTPYIRFAPSENRIYGNNGCNTINASYKYNPNDSTIVFDKMISTMMACGMEGITDYEINAALNNTRRYSWNLDNNNTYYLYFYDSHDNQVMSLMHQNFDFLNGTWKVVSIDDEPVNVEDMKLVIDIDEGKLHGNTGCNILNGSLETDMDTPNSISFQSIATTRMACPDAQYETLLLVALENASHAKPVSSDKVLLLDNNNKVVLTLIRTSDN
ncbi:MAG: META domain-containing protein [Muribaculaceae bacterium]|nr:META domain-containing protein [Muribaculaceae bacterium]